MDFNENIYKMEEKSELSWNTRLFAWHLARKS